MWFVLICVPLGGTAEDIFSRKMFACWKSVHESLTEPCALAVSRRTCQCNILRETITTVPSLAPNPSRVIHLRNGSELPAALNSTARHITNWYIFILLPGAYLMISFNGDGGRNIREEGVVSPFEKLIYQHNMGLINTLPQGVCEFVEVDSCALSLC